MQAIAQEFRSFISDNFLFGHGIEDLANGDSFLEKGIIDSTGVLELIQFIEQTYGLRLADEDLVPENLDSIDNLVAFVERQLPSSKGPIEAALCK
jgi:acyl carrier protein